jgi:hypothetical protein
MLRTCRECGAKKDAFEFGDAGDTKRMHRCRECVQQDRKCNVCNTMKAAGDYEHVRKQICKICDLERHPTIPKKHCQNCRQEKPYGEFASALAKKMQSMRGRGGQQTDEMQTLQGDQAEIGSLPRPEQKSGPRPLRSLQGPQAVRRTKVPSLARSRCRALDSETENPRVRGLQVGAWLHRQGITLT